MLLSHIKYTAENIFNVYIINLRLPDRLKFQFWLYRFLDLNSVNLLGNWKKKFFDQIFICKLDITKEVQEVGYSCLLSLSQFTYSHFVCHQTWIWLESFLTAELLYICQSQLSLMIIARGLLNVFHTKKRHSYVNLKKKKKLIILACLLSRCKDVFNNDESFIYDIVTQRN